MMKSVLISIQPKWCELIASGKKTVEVRKTKPKLETPFNCYIYCTKDKNHCFCTDDGEQYTHIGNGKVIGEFVCDKIYDITPHFDTPTFPNQYICGWDYGKEFDCLSFEELTSYLNGKKGYGWHISDLVIYDEPRELMGFWTIKCTNKKGGCGECETKPDCIKPITRPPQSWCYVEEVKDDGTN